MSARIRTCLALAVLAAAGQAGPDAEGVVALKDFNFEIRLPPDSIDWEIVNDEGKVKQGWKATLRTYFASSETPSEATVQVYVTGLTKDLVRKDLKVIASSWQEALESGITGVGDRRKEGPGKLAGVESYDVDITGEYISGLARRTYSLAKNGKYLYILMVNRTYEAVGDEDLTEEIDTIKASFKFYEIEKPKSDKGAKKDSGKPKAPGGSKEAEVDAALIKRKKIKNSFWKYQCIKPEGLLEVKPDLFADWEKAHGVVQRWERQKNQTGITIRIYVKSLKSGQKVNTLEQHRDGILKQFEELYEEKKRLEPIVKKWKLKGAKDGMMIKHTGKRSVTEVKHWYMADCKNGRQYRLEIYVTGTTGEKDWADAVQDFLKSFKVLK